MRLANLALKFVLELAALAAYAWSLFVLIGHPVWSWIGAIAAVVVVIALWATLVAPTARRKLPVRPRVVTELVVFAIATFLLVVAGAPILAIVLAVLVLVNEILMIRWRQYEQIDAVAGEAAAR